MFRYALKSLRANLTRLVATALAVIIGITFLASGLMLTDAMRTGLTGDVEQQYAAVDLAVQPSGENDFGGLATVPTQVLEQVRATPGVEAATGEIQSSAHECCARTGRRRTCAARDARGSTTTSSTR